MKRLTLVVARYLPHLGGIEIHVSELARRVAAAGWTVTVATIDHGSRHVEQDYVDGTTVLRFPGRCHVEGHDVWSPQLWRYLRAGAGDADVVHVHNYHAPAVLPALRCSAAQVVFTPHYLGVGTSARARAQHLAYRRITQPLLHRHPPVLVHVSHTEATEFRRDLGAGTNREVHVIPNGVRVQDLRDAVPAAVDGQLLLTASRLEHYKRTDLAVRALVDLPEQTTLAIAGDGPDQQALRELSVELGVDHRVRLLGRLSWHELTSWYRAADVFLSLSTRECYGMAVAEALAAGAGVVASDIPAHREVLDSAGYPPATLVPVDASSSDVALAVEHAMHQRTAPGVRPTSTWDDMTERLLSVYRSRN